MPLQISDLCKSFGVDIILDHISMNIADNEKVGLIGANGAGKTTLLKIIAGELSSDSGTIFTPKDARVGFLKQNNQVNDNNTMWDEMIGIFSDITSLETEMRTLEGKMSDSTLSTEEHERIINSYANKSAMFEAQGGFELRARIMSILNGMGFESFNVTQTKLKTLSGGEKTKFALAKLLLEAPEILLLDEPTNHLDFKTMQWLENYLKSYRGAVITVSHDRYFLDSLVDCIYEIERNKAERYTGNYSQYMILKKQNYETELKHYQMQQTQIKKLEEYVDKNRVRASTAKSAKSKQKAIDRMEKIEKPQGGLKACKFSFALSFPSYKDVLKVENLSLQVNGNGILKQIAHNINIDVKRGEKVALIGENGVGKSTLLKTLLGMHKEYSGEFEFGSNTELSFYDQEQKLLHEKSSVLNEIWDRFPLMDESTVRTCLGTVLFSDDDVYKLVHELSGGERARLMLLIIMLEKANTLILDEPTNHLDLPSKEALDGAIQNFEGTVFFVSHDRYFLNKTASRILELTPNGICAYQGNYDDYLSAKSAQKQTQSNNKKDERKENDYESEKRRQANIKNIKRKIENTESKIEATEEQQKEIQSELSSCGSDYDKVQKLYKQSEQCEKELGDLYELWNTLTQELEFIV